MRSLSALILLAAITPAYAASLGVEVVGVRSAEGQVKLMLFDKAEGFRKEAYSREVLTMPAALGSLRMEFKTLPPGRYAVIAYHDENANGKLDLRFGMIPVEGYGISNNPHVLGPPAFDQAVVEVDATSTSISINLSY